VKIVCITPVKHLNKVYEKLQSLGEITYVPEITKDDLKTLKQEIITELKTILGSQTEQKKWLKSADVREMLNISPGTLQNLRVNGTLPFTKMGKTMYYEYDDVIKILTQNKSA